IAAAIGLGGIGWRGDGQGCAHADGLSVMGEVGQPEQARQVPRHTLELGQGHLQRREAGEVDGIPEPAALVHDAQHRTIAR
ncbi:MAG: hypothetical protein ACK56I_25530, partial [bacterium]